MIAAICNFRLDYSPLSNSDGFALITGEDLAVALLARWARCDEKEGDAEIADPHICMCFDTIRARKARMAALPRDLIEWRFVASRKR